MIDVYSTNLTTTTSMTVPFNTVAVQKGYSATQDGTTGINLNVPGIYEVNLSAYGNTTAVGTFGFSLEGNGADIVQGATSTVTVAGENTSVGFSALVRVNGSISGNALLTVQYTGNAGTIALANLTVKKVG